MNPVTIYTAKKWTHNLKQKSERITIWYWAQLKNDDKLSKHTAEIKENKKKKLEAVREVFTSESHCLHLIWWRHPRSYRRSQQCQTLVADFPSSSPEEAQGSQYSQQKQIFSNCIHSRNNRTQSNTSICCFFFNLLGKYQKRNTWRLWCAWTRGHLILTRKRVPPRRASRLLQSNQGKVWVFLNWNGFFHAKLLRLASAVCRLHSCWVVSSIQSRVRRRERKEQCLSQQMWEEQR